MFGVNLVKIGLVVKSLDLAGYGLRHFLKTTLNFKVFFCMIYIYYSFYRPFSVHLRN